MIDVSVMKMSATFSVSNYTTSLAELVRSWEFMLSGL